MSMKKLLMCIVLCIGIMSFVSNTNAWAGSLYDCGILTDTLSHLYASCSWNRDLIEADSVTLTGTFWDVTFDTSIYDGAFSFVGTLYTHKIAPHSEPPETHAMGTGDLTPHTITSIHDHDGHVDAHTSNFTVASNALTLDVVHAPEPVSSTLFLVGAASLGFRRFRKMRKG